MLHKHQQRIPPEARGVPMARWLSERNPTAAPASVQTVREWLDEHPYKGKRYDIRLEDGV